VYWRGRDDEPNCDLNKSRRARGTAQLSRLRSTIYPSIRWDVYYAKMATKKIWPQTLFFFHPTTQRHFFNVHFESETSLKV
jgi:hypothetical protein